MNAYANPARTQNMRNHDGYSKTIFIYFLPPGRKALRIFTTQERDQLTEKCVYTQIVILKSGFY